MLIACERVAYAPTSDALRDLRITFDEGIVYRDLFAPAFSSALLLGAGEAIMEIKASSPFPLWLVHALDACAAYPTSFSKYGAAYRACAAEAGPAFAHMKKGDRCA